MLSQGWPPSESGKAMPERLAAMAGSWRGALSALRSPWGHREDAAPSPRPQALARSPLSDKNPAPRPVGREGLLQQGRWAWFMTAPPFWPCCGHCLGLECSPDYRRAGGPRTGWL